jgi:hypothetical protein
LARPALSLSYLEALENELDAEFRLNVDEMQVDEEPVCELVPALAQDPVQLSEHLLPPPASASIACVRREGRGGEGPNLLLELGVDHALAVDGIDQVQPLAKVVAVAVPRLPAWVLGQLEPAEVN